MLSNDEDELKRVANKKAFSSKDFLVHSDHVFDKNGHNDPELVYFNQKCLSHQQLQSSTNLTVTMGTNLHCLI